MFLCTACLPTDTGSRNAANSGRKPASSGRKAGDSVSKAINKGSKAAKSGSKAADKGSMQRPVPSDRPHSQHPGISDLAAAAAAAAGPGDSSAQAAATRSPQRRPVRNATLIAIAKIADALDSEGAGPSSSAAAACPSRFQPAGSIKGKRAREAANAAGAGSSRAAAAGGDEKEVMGLETNPKRRRTGTCQTCSQTKNAPSRG